TAKPAAIRWLVVWFVAEKMGGESFRAWRERTAAAIASSRAMIDFHGLVLRLTRSTCVDRSCCLPFCTVLLLSRPIRAPTAIRLHAGPADDPGEQKRWGADAPQR